MIYVFNTPAQQGFRAGESAPLLNLQLRAIETTDWERRLAELEKQLTKGPGDASLVGNRDVSKG